MSYTTGRTRTLDKEQYISSDGLSNLLLKEELLKKTSLEFILGIINSSLINYWFSFYFHDVNIKPEQIRKIPIKLIDLKEQKPFIALVNQILESKKQNLDTTDLERKIDEMVYQLYELTPEEITIIEGK